MDVIYLFSKSSRLRFRFSFSDLVKFIGTNMQTAVSSGFQNMMGLETFLNINKLEVENYVPFRLTL